MATNGFLEPVLDYLHGISYDDLPEAVSERALDVVMDTVGCALGGALTDVAAVQVRALTRIAGTGRATALGVGHGLDAVSAVLINAMLSDVLDYEDTIIGLGHPSTAIVPTALAIGETVGASGREILAAVVGGYEVGVRIARAVLPTWQRLQEVPIWQAWNAFGAVAVACKLLGLKAEAGLDAFGYAGAISPLPTWYTRWGRPLHWLKGNYAEQARAGALGAIMAREGVFGPRRLFDSDVGFWRMVGSDRYDPRELTRELGARYETLGIHFKPYPICHFLHPTVEITRSLVKNERLTPDDVEEVVVRSFHYMTEWFDDPAPKTLVDAEFSIPYAVALALLDVPIGPSWYSAETLRNPRMLELASRVRVKGSEEADAGFERGLYPTEVTIRTRRGTTFRAFEERPLGGPGRLLATSDLETKFMNLAVPVLGADLAEHAWRTGRTLPALENVREWTMMLVPAGMRNGTR